MPVSLMPGNLWGLWQGGRKGEGGGRRKGENQGGGGILLHFAIPGGTTLLYRACYMPAISMLCCLWRRRFIIILGMACLLSAPACSYNKHTPAFPFLPDLVLHLQQHALYMLPFINGTPHSPLPYLLHTAPHAHAPLHPGWCGFALPSHTFAFSLLYRDVWKDIKTGMNISG